MNSYKKLLNNSFIFALGNLGSKIISFILVPLYTYYLTIEEYGTVDLLITTVSMLLPIVSFSVFDGVLRFVMEKNTKDGEVLYNSLLIGLFGFVISLIGIPLLLYLNIFNDLLIFLYALLILQILERILAQFSRGSGKTKIFAINGILLTFNTGIFNLFFLVTLKMGVKGYFYSMIIAYIVSILYLALSLKVIQYLKPKHKNNFLSKELLKYSIPMIPNSLMWWLINASSRFFIRYFVGIEANGLFAVSSRIPALINLVNQVFTQAWQLSAIEEFENTSKSEFYSSVFSYLSSIMFIGVSLIMIAIKPIFSTIFSIDYFMAWQVTPLLLLGTLFSCFSGFLGSIYIASKQTKGIFRTSMYGGIVSLFFNIILIPNFGLIGSGISSFLSFFVIFYIRYLDTKNEIKFNINWKLLLVNLSLILIQYLILLISINKTVEMTIVITIFVIIIFINKPFLKIVLILKNLLIRNNK